MSRGSLIVVVLVGSIHVAVAEPRPPGSDIVYVVHRDTKLQPLPPAVDTHTLFLNRCTGGCNVTFSNTPDNRTDSSDLVGGGSVILSEFSQSDVVWGQMMDCLRDVYKRFNIMVTDVDPGTAAHMEVMVAGLASELNPQFSSNVLGVADLVCSAPGNCDSFMPNALVYAFANSPFYTNKPLEMCATAAQEIAHTWALDHVVDATDPMTYNSYNGERQYKDNQTCGSDCVGGVGPPPFSLACTGSGGTATHKCYGTNQPTQNEITTINALFGSSGPMPTVSITSPTKNENVSAGYEIDVACTASDGVANVLVTVGGINAGMTTTAPFKVNAPAQLANGPWTVEAICTATGGGTASAMVDINQGIPCTTAGDCPSTETCYASACVPGPNSSNGLGVTCVMDTDCASGMCASDGTDKHCVLPCDIGGNDCPSGFGCIPSGTNGVCWPGADSGGGGGCNSTGSGGALVFGFGFVGFLLFGRRRRLQ